MLALDNQKLPFIDFFLQLKKGLTKKPFSFDLIQLSINFDSHHKPVPKALKLMFYKI